MSKAKLFQVDIGTSTVLVRAFGPKAALKAALATEIVRVTRPTMDEAYKLGAEGCRLIDATNEPQAEAEF